MTAQHVRAACVCAGVGSGVIVCCVCVTVLFVQFSTIIDETHILMFDFNIIAQR